MVSQITTIGKIIAPFGIKGEVKVFPYSDFLDRCYLLKKVQLKRGSIHQSKNVQKAFIHKNIWILKFEDCHTREDAQKLRGSLVNIPSSQRVPLPPGSYYIDQLVGLDVFTVEGKKIGQIQDILKTGSNDVYIINPESDVTQKKNKKGNKEILIPALKSVVKEINLRKGYLLLDPPAGLLEDV
ncbi:MAG: 16S rRNA processing protein RimM [Firmicutes bacterium]|nr:16S rRNA processing protein RimM [Bacillota bacterium]